MVLVGVEDRVSLQAKAVLAYLREKELPFSWNNKKEKEECEARIFLWHNGCEQGYCISFGKEHRFSNVLNLAFFEHRNSDNICILRWESDRPFFNYPLEEKDIFEKAYHGGDKYNVYKFFEYGKAAEVADFIMKEIEDWWKKTFTNGGEND